MNSVSARPWFDTVPVISGTAAAIIPTAPAANSRRIFSNKAVWRSPLDVHNVFADGDPIVVQLQPDRSTVRLSIPVLRQFVPSNSFSF